MARGGLEDPSFGGFLAGLIDDTTEVVECVPDQRLVLQARGWPIGEGTVYLDLEQTEEGCRVRIQEDASRGPGKLIRNRSVSSASCPATGRVCAGCS